MSAELPSLPSVLALATELRQLQSNLQDGGADFALYCEGAGWPDAHWTLGCDNAGHGADRWPVACHTEYVPGDDERRRFDALAAARRLHAAARDAGFK